MSLIQMYLTTLHSRSRLYLTSRSSQLKPSMSRAICERQENIVPDIGVLSKFR